MLALKTSVCYGLRPRRKAGPSNIMFMNRTHSLGALLFLGAVCLVPHWIHAQDAPPDPATVTAAALAPLAISGLVPFVVAWIKKLAPAIPRVTLPFLCPLIGAGVQALDNVTQLGLIEGGVVQGALYGALGTFLREAYDQTMRASGLRIRPGTEAQS